MLSKNLMKITGKELRELSKERIVLFGLILGPFIMYIVLGGFAALASSSATKQVAKPASIAIIYEGNELDNATRLLALRLNAALYERNTSLEDLYAKNYEFIIIIKDNIYECISHGRKPVLNVYFKPRTLNWYALGRPQQIQSIVNMALLNITASMMKEYMPNITDSFLEKPAILNIHYYYQDKYLNQNQVMGLIMGVDLAIPLAVLMTGVAATQVAAISMGIEKEARTLEKLLTLPLRRQELLLGKLLAVTVLALGGVFSYMLGLYIYFSLLNRAYISAGAGSVSIHFSIPIDTLMVTSIGLALALYSSIVIGFIVGSQATDVRSSQLAANYVTIILAIPLFMLFFGLDPLQFSRGIQILIGLDPYALLGTASSACINGMRTAALASILGLVIHAIFWTLLAGKLLNSESMIIGHPYLRRLTLKFSFKR